MNYTKVHDQITDASQSALQRYQHVVVGSKSLVFLVKYEIVLGLFGNIPGALGLLLRQRLYKPIIKRIGRGGVFGVRLTIRHPGKITLGNRTVVSDGCVLDARGDANAGITIGSNVIIGQNTMLVCKDGDIRVGDNVGIGANTAIYAVAGNSIDISDNVLIAPYTYIGGVSYQFDRTDIPIAAQGLNLHGGISVGKNAWVGVRATLLDGVSVGCDAIISAGAVVTRDVPPYAIVAGVPARIIRSRAHAAMPETE